MSSYPFLDNEQMPAEEDIGFDCDDKINGFYASIKFGCQVSLEYLNLSLIGFMVTLKPVCSSIITACTAFDQILFALTSQLLTRKLSFVISHPKSTVKTLTNIGIGQCY